MALSCCVPIPRHRLPNAVQYRRAEARACWEKIAAPVLVVTGAESDFFSRAVSQAGPKEIDCVHSGRIGRNPRRRPHGAFRAAGACWPPQWRDFSLSRTDKLCKYIQYCIKIQLWRMRLKVQTDYLELLNPAQRQAAAFGQKAAQGCICGGAIARDRRRRHRPRR